MKRCETNKQWQWFLILAIIAIIFHHIYATKTTASHLKCYSSEWKKYRVWIKLPYFPQSISHLSSTNELEKNKQNPETLS